MSLSAEEFKKIHYEGVLAGHCICTPPHGLLIQELTFYYSIWEDGLGREVTDAMFVAWLSGATSFLSTVHLNQKPAESSTPVAISSPTKGMTSLKQLAEMLKMDRSAARRYVLKLGFKPKRARTASSGYQEALVFTQDQVRQIVEARKADGYC
jgi:hypothetical protein